jgi:hypothetical protein
MPNKHLKLSNNYIVSNSTNLANDLINLRLNENHRLITFDIKDLFVNIPIEESLIITKLFSCKKKMTKKTHQILNFMKSVLAQNYFTFLNKISPKKGVDRGSPISNTIVGIFLQYFEINI